MPGVLIGDKYKTTIKIATDWVLKKLGTNVDSIQSDMEHCGNAGIHSLYDLVIEASEHVKERYQKMMIQKYGSILLWIIYKDTAYKDVFIWILWKVLNHAEEIKKMIEPYVKNPDEWYVNGWHDSKKHSQELHDSNKLPSTIKSLDESIYTPQEQTQVLKKYK